MPTYVVHITAADNAVLFDLINIYSTADDLMILQKEVGVLISWTRAILPSKTIQKLILSEKSIALAWE